MLRYIDLIRHPRPVCNIWCDHQSDINF